MKARRSLAREVPIKTVLRDHRGATLLALALTWVLTAAIVVVILFTPTYLQQIHHVPAPLALRANSVATFMFALGCLFFGWVERSRSARAPSMMVGLRRTARQQLRVLRVASRNARHAHGAVRPHRFLRRRGDDGADRRGAIVSRAGALLRPLVFLQRVVRDLRRPDAGRPDRRGCAPNADGAGLLRRRPGDPRHGLPRAWSDSKRASSARLRVRFSTRPERTNV